MTSSYNDPANPSQSGLPDDPLIDDSIDRDPVGSGSDDPMSHEAGDRWAPSASDPMGGVQQPGYSTSGVGDTTTYGDEASDTPIYASGTYSGATEAGSGASGGASETAQQEAKHLKDTTAGATRQVANTAMEQAGQVAGTAKDQASQLLGQARSQLTEQVTTQRDQATGGLRTLADELQTMAECSGHSGIASQLAQQGSDMTRQVAAYLEQRQPSDLVDELRNVARQRPGTFLAGAAVAGMAVGRLTRGAVSARSSDSGDSYSDQSSGYETGIGTSTYEASYTAGLAEPVAAPPMGSMPSPAASPVPPPPPVLEEPYGAEEPPAGYDTGRGDRL